MVTCNCKGCTERYVGCHSTCESYLKFVEQNHKEKEAYRKACGTISLNSNGTMFTGRSGAAMRHKDRYW